MSQQELADAVGSSMRYIQRLEAGETDAKLSSVARLAKALQVEPHKLLVKAELVVPPRGRPPR